MKARFDSTNNEQKAAYRMIERTNNSFFLAGKACTGGKTTFLKNVQKEIKKEFCCSCTYRTSGHQCRGTDHTLVLRLWFRSSRSR